MNSVRYFFTRRLWIPVICALFFAGCSKTATNNPVSAMNDLFALFGKQHYKEAYRSVSYPLQMELSAAGFEAIARDLNLSDFLTCTWTPETNTGKEATLKGEFVSKSNQTMELQATLIKEAGIWKLYAMFTPSPKDPSKLVDLFSRFGHGLGYNDAFTRQLPDDKQARALVTETMLKFNECLHKRNFDSFYDNTSTLWQSQTTPEQVNRAFKPFLDANINLDFVKDMKVIFDEPPRFNSEGYLLIKGYYPSQPNRVIFDIKYVFELPKWKLLGVTINIK